MLEFYEATVNAGYARPIFRAGTRAQLYKEIADVCREMWSSHSWGYYTGEESIPTMPDEDDKLVHKYFYGDREDDESPWIEIGKFRIDLAERDPWQEVEGHPLADWKYEVANNDTRMGYSEWVDRRIEAEPRVESIEVLPLGRDSGDSMHDALLTEAMTAPFVRPEATRAESEWEVTVGNIGRVYEGSDDEVARKTFEEYSEASHKNVGRAAGESVTLWYEGEIIDEYHGDG